MQNEENYSMETHLIQGRQLTEKWDYNHHVVPPISSSTTFRLDSAERGAAGFNAFGRETAGSEMIYIYDRLGEPNKEILEEHLSYAEQGETAVTFTTGMAAISAILGILTKAGDEIIYHRTIYGCTYSLLNNWYPRMNIKTVKTNLLDLDEFRNTINEKTKVVYFESLSNPVLELIDLPAIRSIVDKENEKRSDEDKIKIVVDNTFCTPYCFRPLKNGADFVLHSLTKNIGGFGTDMGGVVITPRKYKDILMLYRKDFGGVLGTKSAWAILVYGLTSLALRLQRQMATAQKVAEFLESHPMIKYVNYPGLKSFRQYELAQKLLRDYDGNFAPGNMIYFGMNGKDADDAKECGRKMIDYIAKNSYTITLAVSLGHVKTLIEHPGSMTHSAIPAEEQIKQGMDPAGIRLSIGLENADDIIYDLKEVFAAISS